MQFYVREIADALSVYDSNANNKKDIKQTIEIWKSDALIANSIIDEIIDKYNGDT